MFEEIKSLGRAALGEATHVLDKIEGELNEAENKSAQELKTAERQSVLSPKSCTDKDLADIRSEHQSLLAAKKLISGSKKVVSAFWQTEAKAPSVPAAPTEPKPTSPEVVPAKQEPVVAKKEPKKNNAVFNLVFNAVGETGGELLGAAREVAGYALEGVGTLAWNSVVEVAKTDPKDLARAFVCVHPQLVGVCLAVNYWDLSSAHEDLKKNPTAYNFLRVAWHSLTFSARAVRLIDASAGSGASISNSDEGGTGAGSGAASAGSPAAAAAGGDAATESESSTSLATVDTGSAAVAIDLYGRGQVGRRLLWDFYGHLRGRPLDLRHAVVAADRSKGFEALVRSMLANGVVHIQQMEHQANRGLPQAVTGAMYDEIRDNLGGFLQQLFVTYPDARGYYEEFKLIFDSYESKPKDGYFN